MIRLLSLALVVGACATTPDVPPSRPPAEDAPIVVDGPFADLEDYNQQRAAAVSELKDSIGTPTASGPRSCLVLPVGVKACGGPLDFVAYSTETAEVPVLLAIAKRVADLDRAANEQFELVSDCMLLITPSAALEGGICELGEAE